MENKEKEVVEFPYIELAFFFFFKGPLLLVFIDTFGNQILLGGNLLLLSITTFH